MRRHLLSSHALGAATALTVLGAAVAQLGLLEELEYLSANGNALDGTVPTQLGRLESLEYLHLQARLSECPATGRGP